MKNNVLEIKNCFSGYKGIPVIKDISFNITEGEFVGLIGPNSAGKTTLLKTISRILKVLHGEIRLFGKNIESYSYKEYSKLVSFTTKVTDYSLKFTVEEFLYLGRYPYFSEETRTDSWNYVTNVMEKIRLSHLRYKKLNELSSGELQQVIISQSVVQDAKLMLLDEPVSHLDISHQVDILDVLHKLNKDKNITILATFHELNLASEYCDKIILISEGKIKSIGAPCEVLDYKVLEEVYKTSLIVKENPISKKPYVFPVPSMWKNEE